MLKPAIDSDMRPHYDFTGGVRGKHYKARLAGYTLKIHKIHKRNGTTQVIKIKRRLTAKGRVKKSP